MAKKRKPARGDANVEQAPRPISAEERKALIRQAAYRRYLERGGADGHALEDWLAAEAEIDAVLGESGEVARLARAAT